MAGNGLTLEQEFLLTLSRMVWTRRGAAKSSGLAFNEETITETILLDLKASYPGHVQIVPFNKAREADTGADWLWAFVSADGSLSLTILVQAKRLDDAEIVYHGINRKIGNRTPPVRQIDQLLVTARSYGVPAIYAFYNHVRDVSRIPKKCGSLQASDPDQIHGFGISLADASNVVASLPSEDFDVHQRHSIPLHCLLCDRGYDPRPDGDTPTTAARGLVQLRLMGLRRDSDSDDLGVRVGLHPVVEYALRLAARRADGGDLVGADEPSNIAGVAVLRDAER